MINTSSLKPSRRKHYRIQVPIRVDVNGTVVDTADWSLGGVRIEGYLGTEPVDRMEIGISIPFQGYWISANAQVKLIRYEKSKGVLALEFVDLPERTQELLEYFSKGLMSGEMGGLEGAIRRLDSPVTPVDIKIKKSVKETTVRYHVMRWFRYAIYVALGIVLTGYVGNSVFERIWLLEVTSASVVSPTEQVKSPSNGVISSLLVSPGQEIEKGTPLFRIEPQIDGVPFSKQQMGVDEAWITLNQLQESRSYEIEKVEIYQDVMKARASASKSHLGQLGQSAALKKIDVDRLTGLLTSGAVSQREVEAATIEWHTLKSQVAVAQSKYDVDLSYLAAIKRGYIFEGERLQSSLADLDLSIGSAEQRLRAAEDQLNISDVTTPADLVLAPFSGRVIHVSQSQGTAIRRGEPVVTMAQLNIRTVEAYLTANEAHYVKLNDNAVVEIRALGLHFNATIISIGMNAELSSQAQPSSKNPNLSATLELTSIRGEGSFETAIEELSAVNSVGLPVKVSFTRSWN